MTDAHLANGQLIRALDDELSIAEAAAVEAHLDACEACRLKMRELGALSSEMETVLLSTVPAVVADDAERGKLIRYLEAGQESLRATRSRLWYGTVAGAALAAGLALVLFAPSHVKVVATPSALSRDNVQVNGEIFVSLPYSNGDLAAIAPRIVEMQLPAASLLQAGVIFEPISRAASEPDRSIRADVLLGADGEPLGVHVLNQE